jgi:hypothetical protein
LLLAFSLYLLEYLEEQYTGKRVLGYDEGRSEALPKWNKLTKIDREEYRKRAAEKKEKINSFFDALFACDKQKTDKAIKIAREKQEAVESYLRTHIDNTKGVCI